MPKMAQRAPLSIRGHNSPSKFGLEQALADQASRVLASERSVVDLSDSLGWRRRNPRFVNEDGEHQRLAILADDEHGKRREVVTRISPKEIDQGRPLGHGAAQSGVVAMVRVRPAIRV